MIPPGLSFIAMSNAVKALNLKLFADEKYLSPSITAIKTDDIDAEEFRKTIKINLIFYLLVVKIISREKYSE